MNIPPSLPIIASFRFRIGSSTATTCDQRISKSLHGLPVRSPLLSRSAFLLVLHLLHRLNVGQVVRRLDISVRAILYSLSPSVFIMPRKVSFLAQTVPSRAMPHDQARDGLRRLWSSARASAPFSRLAQPRERFLWLRCRYYKSQLTSQW